MGLYVSGDNPTVRRTGDRRADHDQRADGRTSARPSFPFKADLDIAELDERGRPGATWQAKASELSRSHMVFRSRRMCYEGRELLVAVHLVDDRPMAMFGTVHKSEYDGDGLYKTTINLGQLPETDAAHAWVSSLVPRRAL